MIPQSPAGQDSVDWATIVHRPLPWEQDAARILGPIFRLRQMAVVEFKPRPTFDAPLRKLPDVIDFVGDTPTAWIDDALDLEAEEWAERRSAPTLLVRTDRAIGLTFAQVRLMTEFGDLVAS